jgi:phosphoribosylglycinamide formyltransferase-1
MNDGPIQPKNRRLGILLSGRGSNFEAIADNISRGSLNAEIAVVVSNVESAPGLVRARERGLKAVCIPSRGKTREQFDAEAVETLRANDVGLLVLAGFLRIFSPLVTSAYRNLILNIHPALLPSFPGLDVQRQALEYGVRLSGCTVHIVNEVLDGGPIVLQAVVPVMDNDSSESLSARILKEEHRIYSEAIDLILSGRCSLEGRRVKIAKRETPGI